MYILFRIHQSYTNDPSENICNIDYNNLFETISMEDTPPFTIDSKNSVEPLDNITAIDVSVFSQIPISKFSNYLIFKINISVVF